MQKIAIVGSEGKYWTPRQRTKVIEKIKEIFNSHALRYGDGNAPEYGYDDIALVSGGCGGATSEDDTLKFNGGVDEWAEIVADFLGVKKDIRYAEVNSLEDLKVVKVLGDGNAEFGVRRKGYNTRNVEVAETCTVLYCIDPASRNWSGGRYTMEKARQLGKEVHLVAIR